MRRNLKRFYGAGDLHFITCSCYRRQPLVGTSTIARCQPIRVNGTQCGSPSLRETKYCCYHVRCRWPELEATGRTPLALRGALGMHGSFDYVAASLREAATPLRMTIHFCADDNSFLRCGSPLVAWSVASSLLIIIIILILVIVVGRISG